MEVHELVTTSTGSSVGARYSPSTNAVDAQPTWYTKDLVVEETSSSPTSSPQLSFGPSPCDSTSSSPLGVDLYSPQHLRANASVRVSSPLGSGQPIFSLPLPLSRARVGSSSSLRLPDQPSAKHRAFASARSPPKRKRSISDSLVSTGSKKLEEDEDEIDEMYIEEEQHYDYGVETRSDTRPDNTQPRAEEDDDESDGFVESGEEGDEGQPDLDTGSLSRAARLQGHESGPPSPPANYYQHGMNENPDGTAYYHCKFCQHTWPQSHFRNAQQFGAHCSNCSRKRKVKDPQDMTTTTRERNKRLRQKGKRSRSNSASKASFDETRHKLIDSDDSTPEPLQETRRHAVDSARRFRARMAGARPLPARPLPPLLIRRPSASYATADAGMGGMERLIGAMQKRETTDDAAQAKKSIFALLACVKTELASLREQEDSEEVEMAGREMIQDTRTEWEARIQELRVDAASDLRAHSAALPRRLERLGSLHPHHHDHHHRRQQLALAPGGARNSLDFILNGTAEADPLPETPAPAWAFAPPLPVSGRGIPAAQSVVPATPPPSPSTRHQQRRAEVLNAALTSP